MLSPRSAAEPADVARHYDELGFFYRQLWGEHLHHGVWDGDDDRSVADATTRLLELATAPLNLRPEELVVDIGCGYGAGTRWIAEHTGAHLTGLTLSPHQVKVAHSGPAPHRGTTEVRLGDWLANDYADHSFEAAVAIESLAHMRDKPAFFGELARTLAPGGRAAIACWTAAPDLACLETLLLRRLCRDGQLSSLGTLDEYRRLAHDAGLRVTGHRNLTAAVELTWWIIGRRALASLFRSPRFLLASLASALRRPTFALTIPAMILAYRTRALRYGILWLEN